MRRISPYFFLLIFLSSLAYATTPSTAPPIAPAYTLPDVVVQTLRENPEYKIAAYIPEPMHVNNIRFSTNPKTGQTVPVTEEVKQKYKQICYYVTSEVHGVVGVVLLPIDGEERLSSNPNSQELKDLVKREYVESVRPYTYGTPPPPKRKSIVVTPQLSFARSACIDLPFTTGQVEVSWLTYGRPNLDAIPENYTPGENGRVPIKKVKPVPKYLDTDIESIEENAQVIHVIVVNVDQNQITFTREY